MAAGERRGRQAAPNTWPGFVDALSTLLLVVMFVFMVFVLAQSYLAFTLTSKDERLAALDRRIAELADLLALERKANSELRLNATQLSAELQSSLSARDRLRQEVEDQRRRAGAAESLALEKSDEVEQGQALLAQLNRQVLALREQLEALNAALSAAEAKNREQEVEIVDLGRRLNLALASKVQELARYRSEFFGRLREAIGEDPNIQIVGDRFVFQAEVLFPSASAVLEPAGRQQIERLARVLNEIARRIPQDIDWVLRVDGHTDRRPIATAEFPSNWELSSARAIAVVRVLLDQGLPPARLVAAGFAAYQPIDRAETEAAFARNRRIEFKLTER